MGYHQCRWGYKTVGSLTKVMTKFKINDLPMDTIWSDLDYMDRKMIFTVNSATHGKGAINQLMKDHDVHFIPLLDAGVCIHDEVAMKLGKELDVFLKSPHSSTTNYLAEVWPGQVHFVDFLHPNAFTFWKEMMLRLYKEV